MKKITRKSGRQKIVLFTAVAVVLCGGATAALLLSSKSKQSVNNSEHIVVTTPDTVREESPKSVDNATVNTAEPVEQTDMPKQQAPTPIAPEKTVYEKYGVSQAVVQQFEAYYPTYAAYNKDLFVSNVATIVSVVGENKVERFLDNHAQATGLKGRTDGSKEAEKNSFFRLIIGAGGYSFNLSWEPWATVI